MHKFGAAGGSAFCEIMLLKKDRLVPARRSIDGSAQACRTASNNAQIPFTFEVLELTDMKAACQIK